MHNRLSAAREKETYIVKYSALDHLKQAVTPVTLTWTLMDIWGNVINSRSNVAMTPSTDNWAVLYGDDLALNADLKISRRILLFKATYNTIIGDVVYNNLPIYIENRFDVQPVEGV